MISCAEYIWLDGTSPTKLLRSKTRIVQFENPNTVTLESFPKWNYDGSSTNQATGQNSDVNLRPVLFLPDPLRRGKNYLVLCEVYNQDGTPHESNTRAFLRKTLDIGGSQHEPWAGFEQEYTLFQGKTPLGWPENGYPRPQGPFYCGVGSDRVFGRELVEAHTEACIFAGVQIYGVNAEVMPGQWEFQIGFRGFDFEEVSILNQCDHLWIARWLLYRLSEDYNIIVSLDNKPILGDWNGAGCHTNFSTKEMRNPETGYKVIEKAVKQLAKKHKRHIAVYGHDLERRLTGHHETCDINEFRAGVADRGASVRIPYHVKEDGCGYLEDRRPGANSDPYEVSGELILTICELDEARVQNV